MKFTSRINFEDGLGDKKLTNCLFFIVRLVQPGNLRESAIEVYNLRPFHNEVKQIYCWEKITSDRVKQIEAIEKYQSLPWAIKGIFLPQHKVTMRSVLECFNPISSTSSLGRTLVALKGFENRISAVHGHVLQTFMGNFSYLTNSGKLSCQFPGVLVTKHASLKVKSDVFVPTLEIELYNGTEFELPEPLVLRNPFQNIGFIVCEDRGISPFRFSELFDVPLRAPIFIE